MRWDAVFVLVVLVTAQIQSTERGSYVAPTRDGVGVYANSPRKPFDRPVFEVEEQARLLVLESREEALKVRDRQGREGWIERNMAVRISAATVMEFRNIEIYGPLDTQGPIYILEATGPEDEPILLDRSFREETKENTDRETVEREITVGR